MRSLAYFFRSIGVFLLASVVCMAVFGLVLALFQTLAWADTRAYKLGSAIASAAIAIVSGGFVAAVVVRAARVGHAILFGFLFGTFSFTYIFGLSWLVIPSTAIAGLLAGFGGKITERVLLNREARRTSSAA